MIHLVEQIFRVPFLKKFGPFQKKNTDSNSKFLFGPVYIPYLMITTFGRPEKKGRTPSASSTSPVRRRAVSCGNCRMNSFVHVPRVSSMSWSDVQLDVTTSSSEVSSSLTRRKFGNVIPAKKFPQSANTGRLGKSSATFVHRTRTTFSAYNK